ncbi:hypothetical protein LEP1GSC052_1987 [Leptospira kmetyi serovar Malaysia str. Bejo-Iso9]|nr:hypothetical protein LEP1GSC052_1987 [Leptospira kmetyi serovar Malaysia str. Bejo-Iso9]
MFPAKHKAFLVEDWFVGRIDRVKFGWTKTETKKGPYAAHKNLQKPRKSIGLEHSKILKY